MARKKGSAHGTTAAAVVPHRERPQNSVMRETGAKTREAIRAQGFRFRKPLPPAQRGLVLNRAHGHVPLRMEAMLMQHGPTAMAFLADTVTGKIPGMTNQQRLDAATTLSSLVSQNTAHQVSAYAALISSLNLDDLSDRQLQALHAHQDDARTALLALVQASNHENPAHDVV